MPPLSRRSLWDISAATGDLETRFIADGSTRVTLATLARSGQRENTTISFKGESVLVYSCEQITAALALIALDGVARRIVLCPPGLDPGHLSHVLATAEVDAAISEIPQPAANHAAKIRWVTCRPGDIAPLSAVQERITTEWVLLTSGTTGLPKMVIHTLETLVGPLDRIQTLGNGAVWSTFYDIRRYGGLQILLRALVAEGSMVLSSPHEKAGDFLTRVAAEHVSHISGTPSHWRRALMTSAAGSVSPRYVRMSGEVADQAIIDSLRSFYPQATVAHAFASTEAGLAFDVNDGRAGFPASLVADQGPGATLQIKDGSLRIRSMRTALRYLGDSAPTLMDAEGFVDTGDMIELRGDRYHFVGRREGIINVGGFKVHPEEVEAVINRHPDVQMSLVKAQPSPITGAIVVAEVVPHASVAIESENAARDLGRLKAEIRELCSAALAPYKVPATIRIVPRLDLGVSGKMVRVRA
jgi:acyl-coenzyme A synthetase/AMP-(fatty) acid ligase